MELQADEGVSVFSQLVRNNCGSYSFSVPMQPMGFLDSPWPGQLSEGRIRPLHPEQAMMLRPRKTRNVEY
jgi:hypothetical protein